MGAGSSRTGHSPPRASLTFDHSVSSNEATETFGVDTPTLEQSPPPNRRSKPQNTSTTSAVVATPSSGASSSARPAPARSNHGNSTRAASAAELNNQLDELDATFTSLGLVGRQLGGSSPSSLESSLGSSQLESSLGAAQEKGTQSGASQGSRGSRASRRTQPFSWEERSPSQADEWTYHKVSLDGFDPEKFKRANKGGSFGTDIRIDRNYSARVATNAPQYDHQDQQILASIERDFEKLIPL